MAGKVLHHAEIGARNNKLVILEKVGSNARRAAIWKVRCEQCGREYTMTSPAWRKNKSGLCNSCTKSYDLTGRRFGRLTVLRMAGSTEDRNRIWECRCDCGRTVTAISRLLVAGNVKSCGCLKERRGLEGKRTGRLTVLRRVGTSSKGILWECRCDCGNLVTVPACQLSLRAADAVRSCGCDGHKRVRRDDSPLYLRWRRMKDHPHVPQWDDYGRFAEWAKCNGFHPGCSLARWDPTVRYGPGNAYWVDNRLRGIRSSQPNLWKRVTVYRDGAPFGEYRSITDATHDVMEEEPGHSYDAVSAGLRARLKGRHKALYLGRWDARYAT